MPSELHHIGIERIGEYIQRNSCPRRFKLDLDGRQKAREAPFFTRLLNPVDPVLQASGSLHEAEWEKNLRDADFVNIATRLNVDGPFLRWDEFSASLSQASAGELIYAREVEVQGIIGKFLLSGRMDFILLMWKDGRPHLRVVECKASRKDRTYHRIQLSTYVALVRQAAAAGELSAGGNVLSPNDVDGALVRLTIEGKAEDIISAAPLDLGVEMQDVQRMLEEGGQLCKVCETDLDDLPFQLDGKCDSCVMNVYCLPESARRHRLELLGLSVPVTRAIVEAGVENLEGLASLDPSSETAERIRRAPSFNERLEFVIGKARARLSTLPGGTGYEVIPLTNTGQSGLPEHCIEGQRLVRCYISVNYDYTENRIAALSAHITDSPGRLETRWEDRKRIAGTFEVLDGNSGPVQGRDVVFYQPTPWTGHYIEDNRSEEALISAFFKEMVSAVNEVGGPGRAPVHLYFWSKADIKSLLEGCTRCSSGLLDALANLLGCREPLEQVMYTVLQEEVISQYALGWTGRTSVVVSSLKWFGRRYHWTRMVDGRQVDLDRVFRAGLFDFVDFLPMTENGEWLRSDRKDAVKGRFEIRCRFNDSLPMPYLHAIWGTLPLPDTPGIGSRVQQMLREYHAAGDPALLKELLRARAHSLRWIEESMVQKNRFLRKAPLELASLSSFNLQVTDPVQAALDLLRLDHHVSRNNWMAVMRSPPRDRLINGETIPLARVMIITERDEAGRNNDFVLGFMDLDRYGEDLSDFRNRLSLEEGSWVRLTVYDGKINASQPLNDFLYHGANGRIEVLDLKDGFVRVALFGMASSRYVLPHNPQMNDGDLVLLDKNPSEFVANRADAWLSGHSACHVGSWFDLSRPNVPPLDHVPDPRVDEMAAALADLSVDGFRLGGDQLKAVTDGLRARVQLLQGPPGTGKTVTTAFAALARAQLSGAGGITIVAANTHYAIDRFMDELGSRHDMFNSVISAAGLQATEVIVHHVNGDLDANIAAAVMNSSAGKHLVIGGTINEILRFAHHSEKNLRNGRTTRKFLADTLVIDEASMMAFPYMMALSTNLAPEGRLMLAGDHRQLSPIYKHDWESEDRPPVIKYHPHYSAYDAVAAIADSIPDGDGRVVRSALDNTYRLPWEVREIISGVYREDGIELSGVKPPQSRSLAADAEPWATVWKEGGVYLMVHDEDRSKNFNEFEVELIEKVLDSGDLEPRSAAVMTPHKAQRSLLKDRLERFSEQVDIIDTVEKLQGGERPTIIVSGTQSDPSSIANTADFILNLNRSNVIFSRAKERLVVVCSRSLLDSVPADNKQYQTARLWKTLRDFCGLELQSTKLLGHQVRLYTHSPEEFVETGAVVDVQEEGALPEDVPALSVVESQIPHKRGATPGILSKFLGPPPIGEIVVDGSNAAWEGRSGDKPSGEQLIACYRDLKGTYSFEKVYIIVGPGLRHKMGLEEYDRMVDWFERESERTGMKILHEGPGGAYDDRFTISFAINDDLLILTNDRYRDIVDHSEDLKYETKIRSVRYTFINGSLRIGQWPPYWAA
jgi:hypothetical protein